MRSKDAEREVGVGQHVLHCTRFIVVYSRVYTVYGLLQLLEASSVRQIGR